jgi:phosphomannomutase
MKLQIKNKKLIAFDVDGTLSISRSKIDSEMVSLLKDLLKQKQVAIITGGAFSDIQKQVLSELHLNDELNKNLILLPTNGGSLFTFDKEWREISTNKLSSAEKEKIIEMIKKSEETDPELKDNISYGEEIQDRGSAITYSALGEDAPIEIKQAWDPDYAKRKKLQAELMSRLPDFEVKIGGTTSIDITAKGIDKAYAIQKLMDHFQYTKDDILFLGDAIYENGNDYSVYLSGIDTIKVTGPEETKNWLKRLLDDVTI